MERPSLVHAVGVSFEDLPGPGLYLRGAGSYGVDQASFVDCGGGPVPGGVFAAEGVTRRDPLSGEGLVVVGSSFSSLPGDGILLDRSSATLADNDFADLAGLDVYAQRCGDVLPPLVGGAEAPEPWCQGVARETAPLVEYAIYLFEAGMEE